MKTLSRRSFIKGTAAATSLLAFPFVSRLSAQNAPGRQIAMGIIGCGGISESHVSALVRDPACRILALCDVDATNLNNRLNQVKQAYGSGNDVATYRDFRELNSREDLDAVLICTPDHWHALIAIDAVRKGKHIYVEKPLTLTILEGRALVAETRKAGVVGQTGTQQRSSMDFRNVAELIRNNRLGKLQRIEILIPANNKYCAGTWESEPVPEGLDWDFWVGPAPMKPFTRQGCHYNFRFISDYACGQITNWGTHYVDIAQWALDMDESGPIAVEGTGVFPSTGLFNNAMNVDVTVTYKGGLPLTIRTRTDGVFDGNIIFHGERGSLDVSRSRVVASDPKLLSEALPANAKRVQKSTNHHTDFFEAIRKGSRPVADVSYGHRTNTVCLIADIAMRLNRPLRWDPVKEEFIGDEVANRMRSRAMRSPWSLV